MHICGVELKGNDATMAVIDKIANDYEVVVVKPRKITITNT